tara:strand:- start:834 stop:1397 length:564 start_codon:yes stop_codon:yes gene_type:complete
MNKKIIIIFFINFLLSNTSLSNYTFSYLFYNAEPQKSLYSIQLIKPEDKHLNYHINWSPTNNLIINTNFINNDSKDNKIYYGINFGLISSKAKYANTIGFGLHYLKFDDSIGTLRWVNYFNNMVFDLYNWFKVNLGLSYHSGNDFSMFNCSIYLSKVIYQNLSIGLGTDFIISPFNHKIYVGINYSL